MILKVSLDDVHSFSWQYENFLSMIYIVSLDDLASRQPYKTSALKDASLKVRPNAVVALYLDSEALPALDRLNPFRFVLNFDFLNLNINYFWYIFSSYACLQLYLFRVYCMISVVFRLIYSSSLAATELWPDS